MSSNLAIHPSNGREDPSGSTSWSDLTPAQAQLRRMVLDSVTSAHSRRNYAKALDLLFDLSAGRPLTRALLMEYRTSMEGLAASTVNVRLLGNCDRLASRHALLMHRARREEPKFAAHMNGSHRAVEVVFLMASDYILPTRQDCR